MTEQQQNYPEYMLLAVRKARENLSRMQGGPFGACIVRKGRVLALGKNTVLAHDATCHAEINAIRAASRKLKTFDLSGCVIYSTTEPCPMCFSAIHWARIERIVYGTSIADVQKLGFNELPLSNAAMKRLGRSQITVMRGFQKKECLRLLRDWDRRPGKRLY